ncbi:MAG: bacillithiol biosynthesis cysteine-adding enzyme BshC, partial [Gemmatimonadota bacterium]|nr:bacillithiol biosynthesis cysteine-adding enzyme BshC [Gemmatimonadota bacterium]
MLRIVSAGPAPTLSPPALRPGGLLPELLQAFVGATGPGSPASRLLEPSALAVTSGQQPGLFSGPLYTIHKAISAAVLARLLEARWARPVVPVFWVAGDDHDFAEAARVSWQGSDGTTAHGILRERPADAPMRPMYREPLGPEIEMLLTGLEEAMPPGSERDAVMGTIRRHYRPDATVAGSCAGLLAEWLGPLGVAVFDPTHPVAKRAQAPLLLEALRQATPISHLLEARHRELLATGADPGVPLTEGASLVMIEAAAGRDRLMQAPQGFESRRSREPFTAADLEQVARTQPERLSPNVLLRPVVESALLPTVAYVAGPAELRYLALARPLYDQLQVHVQTPTARWSGMIVDPRVDRVLQKFNATLDELLEPSHQLETRVVRAQLPLQAAAAIGHLREQLQLHYETLIQSALDIDPTIERSIRNLAVQAQNGVADAEKRLLSHLKKRQ